MADVFISYKKERRAHAERLAAVLEAHGYDVWWDYELIVGSDYRSQIESRLDAAKAVLVLWCTGAVQSRFVRSEAGRADRRGKLIEGYLESVEAPVGFGEDQGASLVGWTGAPDAAGVAGLIAAVAEKTGRAPHPRANVLRLLTSHPPLPALKPIKVLPRDESYPDEAVAERRVHRVEPSPRRGLAGPVVAVFAGIAAPAVIGAGYWVWNVLREQMDVGDASESAEREERERIAAEAAAEWRNVSQNDVAALRRFVAVYDGTAQGVEAERLLAGLDDARWLATVAAGTVEAAELYLSDFASDAAPAGRHSAEAALALADHRAAISRIQDALNAKGFDVGAADGVAGAQTRRQVEAFAEEAEVRPPLLSRLDDRSLLALADRIAGWERPPPADRAIAAMLESRPVEERVFRDRLSSGGQGPEMVVVPAGSFQKGSPSDESGRNEDEDDAAGAGGSQRQVTFTEPFAVGRFEVGIGEWAAFVAATGRGDGDGCYVLNGSTWSKEPRRSWRDAGFAQTDAHPVACISWYDARACAAWLSSETGESYRLLTEGEWEYAARAGTTTARATGSSISTSQANYGNTLGGTQRVGAYQANAFGLYDMQGNVWEWVQDCYRESYESAPAGGSAVETDRLGRACPFRVVRGGSWNSTTLFIRSAYRYWVDPYGRLNDGGFRLARTL